MADPDQASTEPTPGKVLTPVPATPSRETERPAGLAFDVEKGADLRGGTARNRRRVRQERKKEGLACSRLPISGSGGATT
jgi:hypothetical protein